MGLFGVAEVLSSVGSVEERSVIKTKLRHMLPSLPDWKDSLFPILRGTGIGFFTGLIPGPAPVLATYASYAAEKRLSPHPEEFGKGAIEGVAGPESANNAATQSAFIPLFVIGIPFGPVPAILLGALLIHGVTPGPLLISDSPQLFWAVVASMYIGNFILLLLNLPFVPLFANILRVPKKILLPLIMLFCVTGMFSVNNSVLDIWMMLGFGVLGYILRGWAYEGAPLILGLVLGPKLEVAFRQSVMISHGDFGIFVERPVSLVLLLLTLGFLVLPLAKRAWRALRPKTGGDTATGKPQ